MICDANWKTIYNLFKLISSGYLLDCCKNTLSKKFHSSFYSCSFCSFQVLLLYTDMPDHPEKEKKVWHDRCCVEAFLFFFSSAHLWVIIHHYTSATIGNILQTTDIPWFSKQTVAQKRISITLANLAGISVNDWHWFVGSRGVKCSGIGVGWRPVTIIGVQYNRWQILDRCTKEQVFKLQYLWSSTFMNKKKNRKGLQRRELSLDWKKKQKNTTKQKKILLTNRFWFVCLLKIELN